MDIGSIISGIFSQYNVYIIVLAICGCSIGILSLLTLVSIIKELRAEGDHIFPPENEIQVEEGEGIFGSVGAGAEGDNVPGAVEKARPRVAITQAEQGKKIESKISARPGVNAALARSIAEKAQSARKVQPSNNKLEVVPGIMVKMRTLSNLEDAKAVIQRKMNVKGQELNVKGQEEHMKSRDAVELADAMVVPQEKTAEKLEKETFLGVPISETREEARNGEIGAPEGAYAPTQSIAGEGEGGAASIKADGVRISEIDVRSLNTEFVELKESLVLLKTKLRDIEQKRSKR
jgi:hypothetical protein